MIATLGSRSPEPLLGRAGLQLSTFHVGLVALAAVAVFALPGGLLRALLVLPALLWVPGRSLIAALGLARPAGPAAPAMAISLSIVFLIGVALLFYRLTGQSLLRGVNPLVAPALSTPLALLERRSDDAAGTSPGRWFARLGRRGGVAAGCCAAALVTLVFTTHLPGSPRDPYVEFAFDAPYAQLQGVQTVTAGQRLRLPVRAVSSEPAGLHEGTVTTTIDGVVDPGPSTPLILDRDGQAHAAVELTVPPGCQHRVELQLRQGETIERSVTLYTTSGGPDCARR